MRTPIASQILNHVEQSAQFQSIGDTPAEHP